MAGIRASLATLLVVTLLVIYYPETIMACVWRFVPSQCQVAKEHGMTRTAAKTVRRKLFEKHHYIPKSIISGH